MLEPSGAATKGPRSPVASQPHGIATQQHGRARSGVVIKAKPEVRNFSVPVLVGDLQVLHRRPAKVGDKQVLAEGGVAIHQRPPLFEIPVYLGHKVLRGRVGGCSAERRQPGFASGWRSFCALCGRLASPSAACGRAAAPFCHQTDSNWQSSAPLAPICACRSCRRCQDRVESKSIRAAPPGRARGGCRPCTPAATAAGQRCPERRCHPPGRPSPARAAGGAGLRGPRRRGKTPASATRRLAGRAAACRRQAAGR